MTYGDLLAYYEDMDYDIISKNEFFESIDELRIDEKISDVIYQLLAKLKEFFQEMKRRCMEGAIGKIIDSDRKYSNDVIYAKINDDHVINVMKSISVGFRRAVTDILKYYKAYDAAYYDYDNATVGYSKFKNKCSVRYGKFNTFVTKQVKTSGKIIIHTRYKSDAIRLSTVIKKLRNAMKEYNMIMDTMYKDCESIDNEVSHLRGGMSRENSIAVHMCEDAHATARRCALAMLSMFNVSATLTKDLLAFDDTRDSGRTRDDEYDVDEYNIGGYESNHYRPKVERPKV